MFTTVAATVTSPIATADSFTQVVTFDVDPLVGVAFPELQRFDTLGGTRELTGVTFTLRQNLALELYFESTGPTALSAGDFSLDFTYATLVQLGLANDEEAPPLFGTGGFFVDGVTGDLAAYDGEPGGDGADTFRVAYHDAFVAQLDFSPTDADVFAAVTGSGSLTTVFGGVSELLFQWNNDPGWTTPPSGAPEYPTDAAIWVTATEFRHFGEIEVRYDYVTVPEPTTALLLAVAVGAVRRRP